MYIYIYIIHIIIYPAQFTKQESGISGLVQAHPYSFGGNLFQIKGSPQEAHLGILSHRLRGYLLRGPAVAQGLRLQRSRNPPCGKRM